MNIRTSINATLATALLAIPMASQAAFTVDGINTVGEYVSFFNVPYVNEDTGNVDGTGSVALGYDNGNIYLLLEVPTSIQDLTYSGFDYKKGVFKDSNGNATAAADQNAAAGWYDGPNIDHAVYKKVQGSENWSFDLDGDGVKIKMADGSGKKKDKNTGIGDGYKLEENGGGNVTDASTSLDFNMNGGAGGGHVDGFSIEHSPECANPISDPGGGTVDQSCYTDLENNYPDYQYAQRYELEISNADNQFNLTTDELDGIFTDLSFFQDNITDSVFHASKPKGPGGNNFDLPCLEENNCEPPPPCTDDCGEVPVPGTLLLWGAALTALAAARRRRIFRKA